MSCAYELTSECRYIDLTIYHERAIFSPDEKYRIANTLLHMPNLKGVRFLGPSSALPLFHMLPQKLDYLEIFPSCKHDAWQGLTLANPIEIDTLVLLDRSLGFNRDILSEDCFAESLICDAMEADNYSGMELPLDHLIQAMVKVRRLVLRLHCTPWGNGFFDSVVGNVFSDCLLNFNLMNVEEIIFDITMDTMPCSERETGKKWIVSLVACDLSAMRFGRLILGYVYRIKSLIGSIIEFAARA